MFMRTVMSKPESVTQELRKHKRYPLREGASAAFFDSNSQYYSAVGQILDMSIGGMAVRYLSKNGGYRKDDWTIIDIIGNRGDLRIAGPVGCRVAYDTEVEKDTWSTLTVRRCGLEFLELQRHGKDRINEFIHAYANDRERVASLLVQGEE